MNDLILREISSQIEYEAQRDLEALSDSVDDDTPYGDTILEEKTEQINQIRTDRLACLNVIKNGSEVCEELNEGVSDFTDFIHEHGFGEVDEEGTFKAVDYD